MQARVARAQTLMCEAMESVLVGGIGVTCEASVSNCWSKDGGNSRPSKIAENPPESPPMSLGENPPESPPEQEPVECLGNSRESRSTTSPKCGVTSRRHRPALPAQWMKSKEFVRCGSGVNLPLLQKSWAGTAAVGGGTLSAWRWTECCCGCPVHFSMSLVRRVSVTPTSRRENQQRECQPQFP